MIGVMNTLRLKSRVRVLNKTLLMLNQFKTEIEFLNQPLPSILKKFSRCQLFAELDFIGICFNYLAQARDFPSAWSIAVAESKLPYNKQEKERLSQLSLVLGTSDIAGQSRTLELYIEYFKQYCSDAAEKEKKYGNLSVVSWAFIGCLVFVITI